MFDGRLASQVDLVVDRRARASSIAPGVYGERGEDYPDNALRFAAFSRAAAELVRQRAASGRPVDIVHCNDWPTALVPTYLRALAAETPALAATRAVLTDPQRGRTRASSRRTCCRRIGLGWDSFRVDGIEFYGKVNLLKQGIVTADAVTTVSPTYAREIQTAEHGAKLDGVLRERGEALVGITNGVDYAVWNPATDPAIAARYDAEDLANQARCKGALQKELGLPLDAQAPLVASVGRLVEQKGTDLVVAALPKLLRGDRRAGRRRGRRRARARLAPSRPRWPSPTGASAFARAASEPLVHRIFAAADVVLVPSRYEPCGLVQLYAQRYGALPVARATGGLVDTVVDCDAKLETGTGFLFEERTADALLGATERALAARTLPRWARSSAA